MVAPTMVQLFALLKDLHAKKGATPLENKKVLQFPFFLHFLPLFEEDFSRRGWSIR
jgi:hypothetical protein